MSRKCRSLFALVLFFDFLASCAGPGRDIQTNPPGVVKTSPEIKANELPEIQLSTDKGDEHMGKILSFDGETLKLLPHPYWNVDCIEISLDNIHSIQLPKRQSRAQRGAAGGFAWGFLITGTIGLATSRYDEDYEGALLGSSIIGGLVAGLALVIGGLSDLGSKSSYDFYHMTKPDKVKALKKIMGL